MSRVTSTAAPRAEGALAGTAFALVAQLSTALFTGLVTLFLVRALGPAGFGELTLVLSVGGLVMVAADAAISQSTGRFAAAAQDDPDALYAVISSGLRLKLLLATAAAVPLAVLADPIASAYGERAMAWPLRVMALAVVAESVVVLWLNAFQAVRRISLNVRLLLLESLTEATAIVSLVLLGAGVTGAVAGRAVGYAFGAVVGLLLVTRVLGRRPDLRGDRPTRRRISAYARPLFISSGAYSAYTQVDVQLVGALLDRAAVGLYAAPLRLLALLSYPGHAVASSVSPRMAGAEPDVTAFRTGLRWILIYQTALVAPLVLWAEPVVDLLLGDQFRGSAPVLVAMTPYLWLTGISVLASTTVNYLGQARRRIPVVLLSLALNAGLCAVLLPAVGVVGAAVALSLSYAVYVPLHVRICRESFALPLRPHVLTVLRSGCAGLAAGAVLVAIGRTDLSWRQWALGALLAPAAYLGVLVATGELTRDDLRQVRSVLRPSRAATGTPSRTQQARKPAP